MLRVSIDKVQGNAKAFVSEIPISELPSGMELSVGGKPYIPSESDYRPQINKSAQEAKAKPAAPSKSVSSERGLFSQSAIKKESVEVPAAAPVKPSSAAPKSIASDSVKPSGAAQREVHYIPEVRSGIGFDFSKAPPKAGTYKIGKVTGGGIGFRFG